MDPAPLASLAPEIAPGAEELIDMQVPAEVGAGALVRATLAGLRPCPLDDDRLLDARVAVTEAVDNAALHAYPTGDGIIHVTVWRVRCGLAVMVADEGRGFDAEAPSRGPRTGAGVGLRVMAGLASDLRVRSDPAGTTVLMVFRRDASAA
jgi:anti-sigma regulatory factor (Ser/Thr protein kinase)